MRSDMYTRPWTKCRACGASWRSWSGEQKTCPICGQRPSDSTPEEVRRLLARSREHAEALRERLEQMNYVDFSLRLR